jgi:hypothetical protein
MKNPFVYITQCIRKHCSSKYNENILRPPLYLLATPGKSAIHIMFWENGNINKKIINYQYSIDSGKTYQLINPPQTYSPITINGLTSGNTYNIMLRGINEFGHGAPSSVVTVTLTKR